jgi:2,4-dienoyl-CoA reductase (NADPH2)
MTSPAVAEKVLVEDQADAIGFARAFIADEQWVQKAETGEEARIRPCIGLNQDCRSFAPHLHCAVNPRVGREQDPAFAALMPTAAPRRVAVIGGGPAGMEAARIAAARGHDVTLFEAGDGLGGQFLLASSLPGRSGLGRLLDHLQTEIRRLAIPVQLGTRVTKPQDLGGNYDVAILATGATPAALDTERFGPAAVHWFEILSEGAPAPQGQGRALVVDDGSGFWWTYGVANMLTEAGWKLTLATPSSTIAGAIPAESIAPLLVRLGEGNAEYLPLTDLLGSDEQGADLINLGSGTTMRRDFDLVVVQTGRRSENALRSAFADTDFRVEEIGDCLSPRRISHALFEAHRLAATL